MANGLKPISGTSREPRHPGLHMFGWCLTLSTQWRIDDFNPFAKMGWRNFDLGVTIEKSGYTGGAVEVSVSLLIVAFFFEAYCMKGREAFAAPLIEMKEQIERGEVECVTLEEMADRMEGHEEMRKPRGL